jgi:hypothetical protein
MRSFGNIFNYKGISKKDKMLFMGVTFQGGEFYQARLWPNGTIEFYQYVDDTFPTRSLVLKI